MTEGKVCKQCGSGEFYKSGACKPCARASNERYRQRNAASIAQRNREWAMANPELKKENKKKWEAMNRETHLAQKRESARRNYDPANNKRWRAANPERVRLQHANRRARKKVGGGRVSADIVQRLLLLQRGRCACCNEALGDDFHLDHIVPLAIGGTHEDANMQLLRRSCNQSKSSKHPIDYMQAKGFLL